MQPITDSKWIEGLEPGMPIAVAARQVLGMRLQAVACCLGPTLEDADDDPEHVHQLRVSTRRAAAALRIFRDCVPGKQHRQVRRQLRRLRRAAGPIRDWDVFLDTLAVPFARPTAGQRPGLEFLLGFAHGQRAGARARLLEGAGAGQAAVERIREDTLASLRAPDKDTILAKLAQASLGELADDLTAAATQVAHEKKGARLAPHNPDYEHLHRVRIFGKRLRYAMEVFSCCFPEKFHTRIYAAVEAVQEILGQANDSHVAVQHLGALRGQVLRTRPKDWQRWKLGVERLLHFHERRLVRQRGRFLTWWAKWHDSRMEKAFRQMLRSAELA